MKSLVQRVGLQRAITTVNLAELDQKQWAKNMQSFSYLKSVCLSCHLIPSAL